MPSTLRWRCTPIRSNQRRNCASSRPAAQPRLVGRAGSTQRPATNLLCGPGDVAVAQQRDEVVGDGPRTASWKSRMPGLSLGTYHEVARVIVAVHEHARLRERIRDEHDPSPAASTRASSGCRASGPGGACSNQSGNRLISKRSSFSSYGGSCSRVRVAAHLDRARVRRSRRRTAHRRARRVASSGRYIREPRSVISRKPCLGVALEHPRRVDADLASMSATRRYGADVLPVGRRIHHDQRLAARARHAEIAPEAGVGGRGRELEFAESQVRSAQPGAQLGRAAGRLGVRRASVTSESRKSARELQL